MHTHYDTEDKMDANQQVGPQAGETTDDAHEMMANQNAKHPILKQVVASPQAGETTDDAHEKLAASQKDGTPVRPRSYKKVAASQQAGQATDNAQEKMALIQEYETGKFCQMRFGFGTIRIRIWFCDFRQY